VIVSGSGDIISKLPEQGSPEVAVTMKHSILPGDISTDKQLVTIIYEINNKYLNIFEWNINY
jgi:hypothetical protein